MNVYPLYISNHRLSQRTALAGVIDLHRFVGIWKYGGQELTLIVNC